MEEARSQNPHHTCPSVANWSVFFLVCLHSSGVEGTASVASKNPRLCTENSGGWGGDTVLGFVLLNPQPYAYNIKWPSVLASVFTFFSLQPGGAQTRTSQLWCPGFVRHRNSCSAYKQQSLSLSRALAFSKRASVHYPI